MNKNPPAVETVQRQVDAYNEHDLSAFMETYSNAVKIFDITANRLIFDGKESLKNFYANNRFNLPDLKVEIKSRIEYRHKVIDHEWIFGLEENRLEAVVIYEVINGRIERVWFLE